MSRWNVKSVPHMVGPFPATGHGSKAGYEREKKQLGIERVCVLCRIASNMVRLAKYRDNADERARLALNARIRDRAMVRLSKRHRAEFLALQSEIRASLERGR